MMQSESSSELLEGILGDARAEADRLREQARQQAAESLEGAKERAAKLLNGAEAAAQQQAKDLRKNSRSALTLLEGRQELKRSRALNSEVMRRVRLRLEELKSSPSYPPILRDMVVEAALGLGVPEALVNGGPSERKLLTPSFLRDAQGLLKDEFGEAVSLSLSEGAPLEEQGVELTDPEGRRAFRNSFSARLGRMEQEIREIIEEQLREDAR